MRADCTTKMTTTPTRIMFLAWGDSIHARRRIGLFVADPEFDVAVVSTFDFAFPNAKNYLLTAARSAHESHSGCPGSPAGRLRRILAARTVYGLMRLLDQPLPIHEVYSWFADADILRNAVADFKPEMVFLQTLCYPCYLALLLPRSIPLMITFWNGDLLWWAKSNGIERLLKKQLVTSGVRRAAALTVNSLGAVEICRSLGAAPDNVHLIRYPGVDLTLFRPLLQSEARRSLGIDAPLVILAPRGLGSYLNSETIVRALPALVKLEPELCVVFLSAVGGNVEVDRHRALARQLGVASCCRWEGHVPWESMPQYYAAADVMVSLSDNDSLPNCMLEAMACGVPVVMGDIPVLHEFITDGENGFLVPACDPDALARAIGRLVRDEKLRGAFVVNCQELISRECDSVAGSRQIRELTIHVAGRTARMTRKD